MRNGILQLWIVISLLTGLTLRGVTGTAIDESVSGRVSQASDAEIYAFIDVPSATMMQPFVILSAYTTAIPAPQIQFVGSVNNSPYVCPGNPCRLPILFDSVIVAIAQDDSGVSSEEVSATVRVSRYDHNYQVAIETYRPETAYQDTCSDIWKVDDTQLATWNEFPQSPNLLHTNLPLFYLSDKLVNVNAVDLSACSAADLPPDKQVACRTEKVKNAVIEWQNHYDFEIWLSAADYGIPPKILKTLFEFESQFWPQSTRFFLDEYGLGQVNELGIDVLLRWDRDFYKEVCEFVMFDCKKAYTRQPSELRAMLRGVVLRSLDADCMTCPYGLDLEKSHRSVGTLARLMRSNCLDVKYIFDHLGQTTQYEDYWKFTLLVYHAGYNCLDDAIQSAQVMQAPLDWLNVSEFLTCEGAKDYVDQFWEHLANQDEHRYPPEQFVVMPAAPVILPTPTPIPTLTPFPTPTPQLSTASVRVVVFLDVNGDGQPGPGELLNGVPVRLDIASGESLSGRTTSGEIVFDMSGYPVGVDLIVSLPGLYRQEMLELLASGEQVVTFAFSRPALPPVLP